MILSIYFLFMSFEKYVPDYEDKANAARMQKEA